jgi:hypothetical protein
MSQHKVISRAHRLPNLSATTLAHACVILKILSAAKQQQPAAVCLMNTIFLSWPPTLYYLAGHDGRQIWSRTRCDGNKVWRKSGNGGGNRTCVWPASTNFVRVSGVKKLFPPSYGSCIMWHSAVLTSQHSRVTVAALPWIFRHRPLSRLWVTLGACEPLNLRVLRVRFPMAMMASLCHQRLKLVASQTRRLRLLNTCVPSTGPVFVPSLSCRR